MVHLILTLFTPKLVTVLREGYGLGALRVIEVLPAALTFALPGSIESLLLAVVADTMTGRRRRSNIELIAQGAANIVTLLYVAGANPTIRRTLLAQGLRSPLLRLGSDVDSARVAAQGRLAAAQ